MPSASVPSSTTAAKVAPSEVTSFIIIIISPFSNPFSFKVNVYDVSWAFVPQYYTFMNKQPDRLHCFYTKNSTFIHGTEGEDGKPCYGQQEIHNKILSIGFQDCKVFIHSVDAQSSANGGIIIQVIGEMSNNAEPWRKFAQTFFLAEQPHGYFVLNDIFRFLKEETADEESSDADAAVEHTEIAPVEPLLSAQPAHPIHTPAEPVAPARVPTPDVVAPEPAPVVTNGTHDLPEVDVPVAEVALPVEAPAEPAVEPKEATPSPPSPAPQPRAITPVQTPTPAPEAAVPTPVAKPVAPSPAPSPAPPPAPSTPAAPPKPAAPKTWANLAAANPTKWGSQVAQDARGVSAAAPPVSAAPAPAPQQKNGVPRSAPGASNAEGTQKDAHPAVTAANSVTTAQCFVKVIIVRSIPVLNRD